MTGRRDNDVTSFMEFIRRGPVAPAQQETTPMAQTPAWSTLIDTPAPTVPHPPSVGDPYAPKTKESSLDAWRRAIKPAGQ